MFGRGGEERIRGGPLVDGSGILKSVSIEIPVICWGLKSVAIGLLGEVGREREESCAAKASMERVRCFGTGESELSEVV